MTTLLDDNAKTQLKKDSYSYLSDKERFKVPSRGNYIFKQIPLRDPRVWALFGRGDTKGVFQLEKQLGQDWSRRVKPKNIEELAALISLMRPGPLESGIADEYVKRKNGESEITYDHPLLEPILKNTYGLMVFQEQIMAIGKSLAGLSDTDTDTYLRKAIGKKKPEIIAECKKIFLAGCKKVGLVDEETANRLFAAIEKFQRYGFNKSHAISYAKNSYYSAYQKVHFSTEFYTAWLTYSDWKPDAKQEIYELVQNARLNNIEVNAPDVRKKNIDFEIIKDKEIVFGLSHIRGVGVSAIETIRTLEDQTDTFFGFVKSLKKLHRNVAEGLIKSGACDSYELSRSYMLRIVHTILGRSDKETDDTLVETKKLTPNEYNHFVKNLAFNDVVGALQSIINDNICVKKRIPVIEAKIDYAQKYVEDTNRQKSIWEKLYLGLNLTCSAADDVQKIDKNVQACREVYRLPPRSNAVMHVVIDTIRKRETSEKSRNPGQEFCYLNVSDNTGAITNVVCWPEVYAKFKKQISEDMVICLYGKKESWKGKDQVVVNNIVVIG
jgi:DNA polymerase III alpha subunit